MPSSSRTAATRSAQATASGREAAQDATIAGIATPPGRGGIGIVRVSGAGTPALCRALLGELPPPRTAHYCSFRGTDSQRLIDRGIALFFPAPHSFTGEDVLELHAHGSPVVLELLMEALCNSGARPARPGEFSERAFLNGKLDLAQAEAIADLVESGSRQAAQSALHSLQGEFSRRVQQLVDAVDELRARVEAGIDFAQEEDVPRENHEALVRDAQGLLRDLRAVLQSARRGSRLREGLRVVITGAPNTGKSTLLNALAEREVAIVSEEPGTTRDVVCEEVLVAGIPVLLADTAGLRPDAGAVEREGIRRARHSAAQADHLLLVREYRGAKPAADDELPGVPAQRTLLDNKCDLHGKPAKRSRCGADTVIRMSALGGEGLELLRERLRELALPDTGTSGAFSARRRHLQALGDSRHLLLQGLADFRRAGAAELLAEALRQARLQLCEITGAVSDEKLLDDIFRRFCIGK